MIHEYSFSFCGFRDRLTFSRALLRFKAFSRIFAKLVAISALKEGFRVEIPSTSRLWVLSVSCFIISVNKITK